MCSWPGASAADSDRTITIKGSDTMVILAQRWIEAYGKARPGTRIQLTGGGSLTGTAALVNHTTDIAAASHALREHEIARAEARVGRKLRRIPVALDVLTIFVHPSNPIEALTLPQLHAILTGKVTRWSEVGGPDRPIAVYGREASSGTYWLLKEIVLGEDDFAPHIESLPGTGAVVDSVSKDPGGLGYGGIAYEHGLRHVKIKQDDAAPAIEGNAETARSGAYGLARTLYLYTFEPLPPEVEEFVGWTLAPDGQAVVRTVGYYPIAR